MPDIKMKPGKMNIIKQSKRMAFVFNISNS